MWKNTVKVTYRLGRRIVVAIVGGTVVLVGLILLVTPGPAFVVIPAGLAILSIEFAWARRWLRKLRDSAGDAVSSLGDMVTGHHGDSESAKEKQASADSGKADCREPDSTADLG